jgi:hypothetical protein
MESYGVVWQENDAAPVAGKLEIDSTGLRLEGSACDHLLARSLSLADLVGVHVGRESRDRLDGRPVLQLECANGDVVRIAALTQVGIVAEIAEKLARVSVPAR